MKVKLLNLENAKSETIDVSDKILKRSKNNAQICTRTPKFENWNISKIVQRIKKST